MAPPMPVKDKQALGGAPATKGRRNGQPAATAGNASRQPAASQTNPAHASNSINGETPSLDWSSESVKILHEYRNAYNIQSGPSFTTQRNQAILSMSGIARQSPTIARKKDRRKVPKEQLALAIRKHFNGQAVTEADVMSDMIYKVKNQDQAFKLRFASLKPR